MKLSRYHLEAARATWSTLPSAVRLELAELAVGRGELARGRLAEAVLERLLHGNAVLREKQVRATAPARKRLADLAGRMTAVLFEKVTEESEATFGSAYVQQLLALVLPLLQDEPNDPPESLEAGSDKVGAASEPNLAALREVLERADGHEVLAPLALERTLDQLANELLGAAGEELRSKAEEILTDPASLAEPGSWLPKADKLLLSVDHVTLSCARYLAGLQAAERDRYGFDELRAGPAGRAKRVDQVTVKFDPPGETPEGDHLETGPVGSELKAKLFVALFALAAQAKAQGESGTQKVRLRDLLEMLGFELGRVTNSSYYWRYAAQLTRYLLNDMPNRVVAIQISYAGGREPLVVFERLLSLSQPLNSRRLPLEPASRQRLLDSFGEPEEGAALALRQCGVEGFEFSVSDELLEAHGVGKPMNAVEHVPVEVLSLKGPAFWLAWQVAFLRRWASPPASGAQGKQLLRVLEESGHLAAQTRGARVRLKDAVSCCWRDAGELVALGLLEEPGVRLYGRRGSSWRDVSSEVSRSLDPGGERLSRERLREIRVVFQVPKWRVAQLEEARKRKRGRLAGVARAGADKRR